MVQVEPLAIGENRAGVDPARDRHAVRIAELVRQRERFMHSRKAAGQLAQHADVLRSLAGEQKRQLPGGRRRAAEDGRLVAPGRSGRPQSRPRLFRNGGKLPVARERRLAARPSQSARALPQAPIASLARDRRPGGCAIPRLRISGQSDKGSSDFELLEQPVGIIARIREELNVAVPIDFSLRRPGFLEDAMKIAAAKAEGADGRPARMATPARAMAGPPCSSKTASCPFASRSIGRSTFVVGGSTL